MDKATTRLTQRISHWAATNNVLKFESMCVSENGGDDPYQVMKAIKACEHLDMATIQGISQTLWDNAMTWQTTRDQVRLALSERTYAHKGSNRMLYTTEVALRCFVKGSEGRIVWSFEFGLRSPGVFDEWLARTVGWNSNEPTSCQVINDLPTDPESPTGRQYQPKREEWDIFHARGWRISKKKLMWHWDLKMDHDLFDSVASVQTTMLPLAVDWTAYNHRLGAPLVPKGYLHNQRVAVVPLRDDRTEVIDVDGVDLGAALGFTGDIKSGADGSGVYDPEHPQMAELVEKYGPVIFQFTAIAPEQGLFCKGLLRPVENACAKYGTELVDISNLDDDTYGPAHYVNETGVFIDHLQVKGALKAKHKNLHKQGTDSVIYDNVAIGIMDARNGEKEYYPGFEQTECVDTRVQTWIARVDKSLAKMHRPGMPVVFKIAGNQYDGHVTCVLKRGDDRFIMAEPNDIKLKPRMELDVYTIDAKGGLRVISGKTASKAMCLAKSMLTDSLEDLGRGGLEAAQVRAERKDDQIRLMGEFERRARDIVGDTVPSILGLEMVQNTIEDSLQGQLWRIVTGGGMAGKQRTIIMDAAVEPGTVVVPGFKVGADLAVWRFPCIMAAGLLTLKAAAPLRSHLVNNEVVKNAIFMNPVDVKRIQGDDDGDIVGVSADTRMVELFRCRRTDRFFAIEPEGEPLLDDKGNPLLANSEAGRVYAINDPMGSVGIFTIFRSKLLAVNDQWGALAMSCLIQEAIDSAKRKTKWTNYKMAALESKWKLFGDEYRLHYPGSNHYHPEAETISEDALIEEVGAWVNSRLNARGCIITEDVKQNPIAWYYQYKYEDGKQKRVKKRIVIKQWDTCAAKSNGFTGGNLVHRMHDWAFDWWQGHAEVFEVAAEQTNMNDFLPQLLDAIGIEFENRLLTADQYKTVSERIGLRAFGKEMQGAMKQRDANVRAQEVQRALDGLNANLALNSNLQDIVDVWRYNMTPQWKYRIDKQSWRYTTDLKEVPDNCVHGPYPINHAQTAFRVTTHPNSEVLLHLGIEPETHCPFLDKEARTAPTRLQGLVNLAVTKPEPFAWIAQVVFSDKTHGNEHTDEDGHRIELHECEHCRQQLQTALVRRIRQAKQVEQTATMRALMTSVRQAERFHSYPRVVDMRTGETQRSHDQADESWDLAEWGI